MHAKKEANMKQIISLVAAAVVASAAFGEVFVLQNGSNDWTKAGSYLNTSGESVSRAPDVGDTIYLAKNGSWTVNTSTDTANLGVIQKISRIGAQDGSTLTINVPSGVVGVPCAISTYGINAQALSGKLVKDGSGELDLTAYGIVKNGATTYNDYYVSLHVKNGVVKMPQDDTSFANSHPMRALTVDGDGVCIMPYATGVSLTGLSGAGIVSNAGPKSININYNSGSSSLQEFSGAFKGKFRFALLSGRLNLSGTASTMSNNAQVLGNDGTTKGRSYGLGLATFGGDAEGKGSLGLLTDLYMCNATSAGRVIYLGSGETVTNKFLDYGAPEPAVIDGGVNGGLVLNNQWDLHTKVEYQAMHRIVLTGDHSTPCEVAGRFVVNTPNDSGLTAYVAKEGSGVWRMRHHNNRKMSGAWAIRAGTLQFDSIAEKGVVCSLGLSTLLCEDEYVLKSRIDETNKVDYAFLLGTPETEGVFEYTGSAAASCSTRPLHVNGKGRIKTSAGSLYFSGVTSAAADSVLTLDGSASGSELAGVTDGAGLSIVKEGSGDWTLDGPVDLSGTVAVRGTGTLKIHNPSHEPYKYFKLTIKENAAGSPVWTGEKFENQSYKTTNSVQLLEFGLYDRDGNRQNRGLKKAATWLTAQPKLKPGECAVASSRKWVAENAPQDLEALFDDVLKFDGDSRQHAMVISRNGTDDPGNPMVKDNPDGWLPIVMRLTNGTPEIVSYDICYYQHNMSSGAYANPTAFEVFGSSDGETWVSLSKVDCVYPTSSAGTPYVGGSTHCWISNHDMVETVGTNLVRQLSQGKSLAFLDEHGETVVAVDTLAYPVLPNISGFSVVPPAKAVATGPDGVVLATLSVDALATSAEDTFTGFALANSGTLTVANVTSRAVVDISGCFGGLGNLEALRRWTLVCPGGPNGMRVSVRGSRVLLVPPGFNISIR
jgi:hypothetical protein